MVVRHNDTQEKPSAHGRSRPRLLFWKRHGRDGLPEAMREHNPYSPPSAECTLLKEKPDYKKLERTKKRLRSWRSAAREKASDELYAQFQRFKDEHGHFAASVVDALLESRRREGERAVLKMGFTQDQIAQWRGHHKSRMRIATMKGIGSGLLMGGVLYPLMSYLETKGYVEAPPPDSMPMLLMVVAGYYLLQSGIDLARTFERTRITHNTKDKLGL